MRSNTVATTVWPVSAYKKVWCTQNNRIIRTIEKITLTYFHIFESMQYGTKPVGKRNFQRRCVFLLSKPRGNLPQRLQNTTIYPSAPHTSRPISVFATFFHIHTFGHYVFYIRGRNDFKPPRVVYFLMGEYDGWVCIALSWKMMVLQAFFSRNLA